MPLPVALLATCVVMFLLAYVIERCVLRPLVNQPGIALFVATLGVTFFLEGFGQIVWGSDIYKLDLGIPKQPIIMLDKVFDGGILVNSEDLFATVVSGVLVIGVACSIRTVGRAGDHAYVRFGTGLLLHLILEERGGSECDMAAGWRPYRWSCSFREVR